MRRVLVRVVLSLAVGLIATVAVAWGIELLENRQVKVAGLAVGVPAEPYNGWMSTVPEGWPDKPNMTTICIQGGVFDVTPAGVIKLRHGTRTRTRQGMGMGSSSSFGVNDVQFLDERSGSVLDRVDVGWPIATMRRRGPEDMREPPTAVVARLWKYGVEVPVLEYTGQPWKRRLPLRPIWTPFLASVAGWGAVLTLPYWSWTGVRTLRDRRRARTGCCANCGYELGDLDTCPECGHEIEIISRDGDPV